MVSKGVTRIEEFLLQMVEQVIMGKNTLDVLELNKDIIDKFDPLQTMMCHITVGNIEWLVGNGYKITK